MITTTQGQSMNDEPLETDVTAWIQSTGREVRRDGDKTTARLRCRFATPRDAVWTACSDRDHVV